ncbi:MAG TPA: stalk domain-containing protein [Caldisericia bacterium]|nr:stalk domain-containing protein [Caldisericia bacterium]
MKKRRIVLLSFIIIFSLLSVYIPKVYGGPATHFEVIVPSTAKIGIPFNITIRALDASNLVDTTYTHDVNLTDSSTSISISSGSPFTITNGVGTGSITLSGSDLPSWTSLTITATRSGVTGTSSGFQVTGANPAFFTINLSSLNVTVGDYISFTVIAKDVWNNIVGDYNGTVTFTSDDPQAEFSPSNYTFISSDNGSHTFTNGVRFKTASPPVRTITVSDGAIFSTSAGVTVGVSTLHHFEFYDFFTTTPVAGSAFTFRVKAVDEYGNIVTNYTGTVHFSTTDTHPSVVLPSNTTYLPANNGDRLFTGVILCTAGPQTIYVEDTSNPLIKGNATLNVQPQGFGSCTFIFDSIGPQTRNNPFPITIKVKDSYGNVNPSFNGTVTLAASSGTITVQSTGTNTTSNFNNGIWSGNIILDTANSTMKLTITASNPPGVGAGTGSNTFTVSDPDSISFQFEPIGNQSRNTPFQITVKAVDSAGSIVTAYNGQIKLFISTTGGTITPNIITLTNGVWTGNITLNTSDSGAKIYANSLYGEYIYFDTNVDGTVNVGDKRLTYVRNYVYNTFVASGNIDIGFPLTSFQATEKHTENVTSNSSFDYGEYIYDDITVPGNQVSPGDKRLTPVGNYRAGTIVQAGDSDVGTTLVPFQTSEKHTEHILGNSLYDPLAGESNLFSVSSGAVDHFEFSTIISPQTAGVPFSVTIYAKDSSGMTVTSFNQQVIISSSPTMCVSTNPSPVVFVNGVWSGSITLNTPSTAVKLIATYGSSTGESNIFALQGTLSHFSFSFIPSPQKVGQSFYVEITARDGNENLVTNFIGNVNLTLNPAGPISPSAVGPFVNGKWSGYVTINSSFSTVQLVATDSGGSGMTGYSNTFSVLGSLDHYHFSSISPQVSGVPFSIRIEAHDSQHNLISDLNTTLMLSSSVGNIIPTSINLVNGVFEGNVTLDTPAPSVFITASGLSKFGTSNNFTVSAGLHHFDFDLIGTPQTAGNSFSIKIYAKDSLNNLITNFNAIVPISATVPTNYVIDPTSVTFSNGIWSGYITLYKSGANVQLKVEFASKYGVSNNFNVLPGPLHHFKVTSNDPDPVTGEYKPIGPQTVGCVFNPGALPENALRVTAKDQWDNIVTTYTGTIHFTSTDGAASLPADYLFALVDNGTKTFGGSTTMNTVGVHTITVTDTSNPGIKGTSNQFTVASQTIHHFDFETIGPQTINNPFNITIYAKDANGYIVSAFDDTGSWVGTPYAGLNCFAILSASTGNINGGATWNTTNFTLGKWIGSVSLDTPHPNMKITSQGGVPLVSRTSNSFTCASNVLGKFEFDLIPNQTAGVPFSINIRALDLAGSLITTWNGTAILTSSTGAGTISPSSTTSFVNGRWTGNITITTPNPSTQIFAEDPVTHKMGMSNIFSVYGALDHFTFDTISSPQTAGTSFTIKIYAKDSLNNTIPNFTEQVNLSVSDGTINPTITGYFSGGTWIGNVTLTKAGTNIKIIAEKSGKTGESNAITLLPAPVNRFEFSTIGSQSVGVAFSVTITAKDEFGNTCTNFNGSATLSAVNSTVTEPTSITFVNGVWSGNVKLGTPGSDVQLKTILTAPSVSSTSNKFSVAKGLHHFLISTIGNQNKGVPFEITVTAKDEDNLTFTNFTGTVNLTCSLGVGTIEPITLGPLVNGTITSNIKINKPGNNVTITVTDPVSEKTGTSNSFKVAGDKLVFKSSPQTINLDEKSLIITIGLLDPSDNPKIASENITVNLSSSSSTGKFSEDGLTWNVTSVTFASGSSEKSFYYKDTTPGAWDITVSATSYESAVQRIIVTGTKANGSGTVTMTPSSGLTNDKLNITFTFTGTYNLSGGGVKVTFPSGFPLPQLTNPQGDGFISVTPGSGVTLGQITTVSNTLNINVTTLASGDTITIKYQNVTLPNIPQTYTFSFMTMGQGGTFTPISNQPQFIVELGFYLEILSLSVNPSSAAVNASYTIIFKVGTRGELDTTDEINIKFPSGTMIPINIQSSSIKINDSVLTQTPIVNQSANTITIKPVSPIPKETTVKIEILTQAGVVNPSTAGIYNLEITTTKETRAAKFSFTLSPAPPIGNIEVDVKPQSAGRESEYTIRFRIGINLFEGDKIYIKFPQGTTLPPSILPTSISITGIPLLYEPLVVGRLLILPVSFPIPKGDVFISISKSAKIKNPEIPDKYILYIYSSKDLTEVPSSPYTIVGTPVTVITVTPEIPDGINGWYITKPKIKLEGRGEGSVETYYYWDDGEPTLYVTEISAPEGEHILNYYSKSKGLDNAEVVRNKTFKVDTMPPKITILEPQFDFTNKEDLVINGVTEPGILVTCGSSMTTSNSKGQFTLKVKLSPGLNTLKVQALDSAGNKGEITISITLDTSPPFLKLDSSLSSWMEVNTETLEVKGEVEVGANLTINGVPVSYDSQGKFSYTVRLQEGNNSIQIVAVDKAGNSNSIYLPVKYVKRTIVKIKIGSKTVYVNDRPIEIEAAPWIDAKSGRAMVPLRVIVEAFGATVEYRYISFDDERVSIIFNLKRIDLRIGSNIAYIEGLPVKLDAPPVIINDRTFVPIRFIMETFGAKVDWDPFSSEITITYPAP